MLWHISRSNLKVVASDDSAKLYFCSINILTVINASLGCQLKTCIIMARSFIYVCLLFVAVASCRNTYQLARRVEQSLVDRSTYLGGWPLAAVPCPSDASVACDTGVSSQINQQCCPSGNTCYSWPATIPPVCCPSCTFSSLITLCCSITYNSLFM